MSRLVIPFAALAALASPAVAQSQASRQPPTGSPYLTSLAACQKVTDATARLACFDRAAAALVGGVSSGQVALIDRENVRKVRRSLFGFSLPEFPFFAGSKEKDKEEEPRELTSTLAAFSSIGNGRYRFRIADGNAVWETTESALLSDPKMGSKVEIKSGVMGSYFAQIGNQKWVRARRVR